VRILTANLLFCHADTEAFGQILDEHRPDVVAVQELGHDAARAIEQRYPHHDLTPTDTPRGMGIAAAHPAVFDRLSMDHDDGWRCVVDGIEVMSVHVHTPVNFPLVSGNRKRRSQVRSLIDHAARTEGPLVLAGDFNASPAWPAYRRLTEVFDDAVVQAAGRRQARSMRTWGPKVLGGRKLLRIDHVLVRGLRCARAEVVAVAGSDHAAVVVDLAGGR
jgi:endonuclease/exonuclease/phosphatase (EEP) superfamily protein YafD